MSKIQDYFDDAQAFMTDVQALMAFAVQLNLHDLGGRAHFSLLAQDYFDVFRIAATAHPTQEEQDAAESVARTLLRSMAAKYVFIDSLVSAKAREKGLRVLPGKLDLRFGQNEKIEMIISVTGIDLLEPIPVVGEP